jgi:hypothetical protein
MTDILKIAMTMVYEEHQLTKANFHSHKISNLINRPPVALHSPGKGEISFNHKNFPRIDSTRSRSGIRNCITFKTQHKWNQESRYEHKTDLDLQRTGMRGINSGDIVLKTIKVLCNLPPTLHGNINNNNNDNNNNNNNNNVESTSSN